MECMEMWHTSEPGLILMLLTMVGLNTALLRILLYRVVILYFTIEYKDCFGDFCTSNIGQRRDFLLILSLPQNKMEMPTNKN